MLPISVNQPLKAVTDRIQSCRTVKGAIEAHGEQLVEVLDRSYTPLLGEGQSLPFETTLDLFKKQLVETRDELVASDRAYRDQKAREAIVLVERDELVDRVNSHVVGLRQAFVGIYGETKLAEIGFARRTPRNRAALMEQATHLVARLSTPDLDLSGSLFGDLKLSAPEMSQDLIESAAELDRKTDELEKERRTTEAMKLVIDATLASYNSTFLWIARVVESLCQLAGLEEVARRVRPSRRRPGVTAQEEPEGAESAADGQDGDSEAESEDTSEPPVDSATESPTGSPNKDVSRDA